MRGKVSPANVDRNRRYMVRDVSNVRGCKWDGVSRAVGWIGIERWRKMGKRKC